MSKINIPAGYSLVSAEAYGQRYHSLVAPDGKVIENAYEQGAPAMFAFLSALAAVPTPPVDAVLGEPVACTLCRGMGVMNAKRGCAKCGKTHDQWRAEGHGAAQPERSHAADAMRWLNQVELAQGGSNGPTVRLRAAIQALTDTLGYEWNGTFSATPAPTASPSPLVASGEASASSVAPAPDVYADIHAEQAKRIGSVLSIKGAERANLSPKALDMLQRSADALSLEVRQSRAEKAASIASIPLAATVASRAAQTEPVATVLPGNGFLAEVPNGLPPGTKLYAATTAPAATAEPMAWADDEGRVLSAAQMENARNHQGGPGKIVAAKYSTPLFPPAQPVLAPVVREPLTEAQALAANPYINDPVRQALWLAAIRFAERFHGIQATTGEQSHG